ncbi:MAG: YbaY family lipoprotein, partial [Vicinamibacteria bacterium]
MTIRRWLPLATLLAVVLFSCDSSAGPTGQTPGEEGVVRGTVSYRERVALPPDAVVEVWITDVSPLILAQSLLAETTVSSGGRQVPIPFELRYDPSRVVADHDYAVKAAIRSAGEILFATAAGTPVITKGNPTEVELWAVGGAGGAEGERIELQGTAWRLEDLGGEGALDTVEATLEFPEAGRVAGSGSCNRFFWSVEISGESIR